MATTESSPATVSERQARQVAEAARESEWRKPSFGKELFLGRFRLDLIDPRPEPDQAKSAKAEEFLGKLGAYMSTVDGLAIERDARIPDDVLRGLADLGAFGMKIDEKYGGLGLTNLHYCQALTLAGSVSPAIGALLSAHHSIGTMFSDFVVSPASLPLVFFSALLGLPSFGFASCSLQAGATSLTCSRRQSLTLPPDAFTSLQNLTLSSLQGFLA